MDPEKILQEKLTNVLRKSYITVNGFTFPETYAELKYQLDNLEVNEEDVWICTFPKSGTTWTQEMVWMIVNNLDFEKAKDDLGVRSPFLESSIIHDYREFIKDNPDFNLPPYRKDSINFVKRQKSPLVIKTHLPLELLPKQIQNGDKNPKIIYVSRDPKDTCVSYYHHSKLSLGFKGDFDEFCEMFLAGKVPYGPYWKHVLQFWKMRNSPNFLYLRFEDMKKDLNKVIITVAEFLGRSLSDAQVESLAKHLSFESMKENRAVNKEDFYALNRRHKLTEYDGKFIRSGIVGSYKTVFQPETVRRFEQWIKDHTDNTDYTI